MHDSAPPSNPSSSGPLLCRICNRPITLEEARTDKDGKAVHEECIAEKLTKGQYRVG